MLSAVKHPRNGFLALARNDTVAFVMLSEAKHPCTGFLACARNDTKSARHDTVPAMTKVLGITSPVMLNEAQAK